MAFVWENSEGQEFSKVKHALLNEAGLKFPNYFPTRRRSLPWGKKGDHLMDLQKIFVFSHLFFSLQNSRTLSRSWFILSVGLSTWYCFGTPETKPPVPHWPGLLYHLIRVPPLPCTAEHPHRQVYRNPENLTSNKALGIRLFSMLKVFIWKITLFV